MFEKTFCLLPNVQNIFFKHQFIYKKVSFTLSYLQKPRSNARRESSMIAAWLISAKYTASCEMVGSSWSISTKKRIRQIKAETRTNSPKNKPLLAPTQSTLVYVIIFREVTETRSKSSSPQNLKVKNYYQSNHINQSVEMPVCGNFYPQVSITWDSFLFLPT